MGKLIIAVVIVAGVAFAWHKGWIGEWIGSATDAGIDSVKRTQRDATKVQPAEPEKK